MQLEDYLNKDTESKASPCYQTILQARRRFEVWTIKQKYIFSWMHVVQAELNLPGTELTVELSHAHLCLKGRQLEPLYQAFLKEELDWVKVLPERSAFPEELPGPFIQTIQLEPKGPKGIPQPSKAAV